MYLLVLKFGEFSVYFFDVDFYPEHVVIAVYSVDYTVVQTVQLL